MSVSYLRRSGFAFATIAVLLIACSIPLAQARDDPPQPTWACPLPSDNNIWYHFILRAWVTRGACIRTGSKHPGDRCEDALSNILDNLTKLREAEYAGAASVLSLLPTIGALFGTPTSEIWRLKMIVPFGGALAMTLSFGGALMPVRVEDYENTVSKQNTAIGSIISLRKQLSWSHKDEETVDEKLQRLGDKVRERIDQHSSVRLPKQTLLLGMGIMITLSIMAQVAMAVVEQGGVINWWCSSRWWMHLWYFAVTFTAFTEDRVQRPFIKTYELFVSSLPYDVETNGGQPITDYFGNNTPTENVALALKQLKTLKPASLTVFGSRLRTRSRNSVMVIVSIVGQNKGDQIWRLLSKSLSVGVFVAGTAIFASVTLLSLIMAIVVLTLTLAAGIFGRAIAGWIVGRVSGTEPMIHVISSTEQEAYQAITEILTLKSNDGTHFQVEINGHILINERRVASRSRLIVATLGVLAEPYDVTKAHQSNTISPVGGMSLSALSPQLTNRSMGGVSSPFLGGAIDPVLPLTRRDKGFENPVTQQRVRSNSTDSTANLNHHIPRRPVPSTN